MPVTQTELVALMEDTTFDGLCRYGLGQFEGSSFGWAGC